MTDDGNGAKAKRVSWEAVWKTSGLLSHLKSLMHPKAIPAGEGDRQGLLPLVIGVTGHRNLAPEDRELLGDGVRRVLRDLQTRYPHTPLILLSPLAEGADRLVAEIFLEEALGQLIVPLPMEMEDYQASFTESTSHFDALLRQAEKSFVIPKPPAREKDSSGNPIDWRLPPHCYEAVGAYLVEHCHVLLALWDGLPLAKPGGTSQVVNAWLSGQSGPRPSFDDIFDPMTGQPVIHIRTRRKDALPTQGSPLAAPSGTVELLLPSNDKDLDTVRRFRMTLEHLDIFNREALEITLDDDRLKDLCPYDRQNDSLSNSERIGLLVCGKADILADKFSKKFRSSLKYVLSGTAAAIITFQLYGLLSWFLLPFFDALLIGAVLFCYARAKYGDWQNRHLSYRGLAEGLRVHFFWRLAGIRASVARHGFSGEKMEDYGETRWLRQALAYMDMLNDGKTKVFTDWQREKRTDLIFALWIKNQQDYFTRKSDQAERIRQLFRRIAISCLALGGALFLNAKFLKMTTGVVTQIPGTAGLLIPLFIMAGAAAATFGRLETMIEWKHKRWLLASLWGGCVVLWAFLYYCSPTISPALSASAFSLLSIAVALLGYMHLSGISDNAKRYRKTGILYARALQELEACRNEDPARFQAIIVWLGERALAENSIWMRQHIERPIEMPVI